MRSGRNQTCLLFTISVPIILRRSHRVRDKQESTLRTGIQYRCNHRGRINETRCMRRDRLHVAFGNATESSVFSSPSRRRLWQYNGFVALYRFVTWDELSQHPSCYPARLVLCRCCIPCSFCRQFCFSNIVHHPRCGSNIRRIGTSEETGFDDITMPPEQREGLEATGKILSSMCRVGCAAKVVQMGRVTGSDSFKVNIMFSLSLSLSLLLLLMVVVVVF